MEDELKNLDPDGEEQLNQLFQAKIIRDIKCVNVDYTSKPKDYQSIIGLEAMNSLSLEEAFKKVFSDEHLTGNDQI